MSMHLVRMRLAVGEHEINTWVARTPEQRALGLMHRVEMAPDEGMLFVCDACEVQSFWMKDTPVPLSIAFLEEDGTIVQVGDMQPHSLESHSCAHPVRYVLEVPQGWFDARGIGPGAQVTGPIFLAAAAAAAS